MSILDPSYMLMINGQYQFLNADRARFVNERGWVDLVLCSTGDWLALPTQRMVLALRDPYSVEAREYQSDMIELMTAYPDVRH